MHFNHDLFKYARRDLLTGDAYVMAAIFDYTTIALLKSMVRNREMMQNKRIGLDGDKIQIHF